jgi:hypothetical protein
MPFRRRLFDKMGNFNKKLRSMKRKSPDEKIREMKARTEKWVVKKLVENDIFE